MSEFWQTLTGNNLVRQFPGRWTLYWLLLPNLAIILMWPIGGPPMSGALIVYGPLALLVSQLRWWMARMVGIALLTLWIVSVYVCKIFSIPTLNIGLFVQFLSDVRPLNSPEYLWAGIGLLAVLALAMVRGPAVPRFSGVAHYLLASLGILAFVNIDTTVTARTSAGYRMLAPADARFDSAVRQVGLRPDPTGRHVLVIVVEALGLPVGEQEKRLFAETWDRPEWRSRYTVVRGSTLYFGATTSGELRELCGRWTHHSTFDFAHADCLPGKFRAAGYETFALHSFDGGMFQRTSWYPKLGFTEMEFGDGLLRDGVGHCDGVFPGACDKDVPAIIGRRLATAQSPQFIYWLTLNSHIPVVADGHGGRCLLGGTEWRHDYAAVCRLLQAHRDVADAIDRMLLSPDFPPTDILIVGDHKPPFFDRASRNRFDEERVPWIYLKARD